VSHKPAATTRSFSVDRIWDIPWGTHFCYFYESKQDLVDVLVSYFAEGLKNNESCLWVTSPLLEVKEAKEALAMVVPDLNKCMRRRQMEIIPYDGYCSKDSEFDADKLLDDWKQKEKEALEHGFEGLRVAADAFWLKTEKGQILGDHEEKINRAISQCRILALCTYCLGRRSNSDVLYAVRAHACTLIKRGESWSFVEDSVNHKKVDEELTKIRMEEPLAEIIQTAWIGVAIGYPDGSLGLTNAAYQRITGYDGEELKTINWKTELTPPEWQEYEKAMLEKSEKDGKPVQYEEECLRKDGFKVPVAMVVHPICDSKGKVAYYYIFVSDITDRKKVDAKIQRQNATLNSINRIFERTLNVQSEEDLGKICLSIAEQLTQSKIGFISEIGSAGMQGIIISDPGYHASESSDTGKAHRMSPGRFRSRGIWTRVLLEGKGFFTNSPSTLPESIEIPGDHPPLRSFLGVPLKSEGKTTGIIAVGNREDGYTNDELESLEALAPAIVEAFSRKRFEEALRKSRDELEKSTEERMETIKEQAELLDKASDAIIVRDLDDRVTYWNKGAERIYGWTSEDAIGRDAGELLNGNQAQLKEAISETICSGQWSGEVKQKTKEGMAITVHSSWTLVSDANQEPKAFMSINTDITEKKSLEAQYLRAQRLESLGTLAGGIAHDFRNILTPVMITLGLIDQHLTRKEDHEMIAALQRNLQRGADLSKQLLTFTRGAEGGERTPISVTKLIKDLENTLKETFPRRINIETKIAPTLPAIIGDSTQLHQVLINMSINAKDAMPFGGTLSITAESAFVDQDIARLHPDAKIGSYVMISVVDDGTGMPPEVLDRLFEPFFTTKKPGEGTGLGLSTARSIVKNHGGFITVYSEVGKGAQFKIYLPVESTKADTQESYQDAELLLGNGQTILVVDDEELLRTTVLAALEVNGYKGLGASDGAEALGIYMEHKDEIKVVLIDMVMPVLDGEATIRALRKISPKVKLIGMSGLAENPRFRTTQNVVNAFMTKPFTAAELLRSVARVMSS